MLKTQTHTGAGNEPIAGYPGSQHGKRTYNTDRPISLNLLRAQNNSNLSRTKCSIVDVLFLYILEQGGLKLKTNLN